MLYVPGMYTVILFSVFCAVCGAVIQNMLKTRGRDPKYIKTRGRDPKYIKALLRYGNGGALVQDL